MMSPFVIQNGDARELPNCDHKESSYFCIGCNETVCTHCSDKYQDDSGEYYCSNCKDEYLVTCDRCNVLSSETRNDLCENCSDEMRG